MSSTILDDLSVWSSECLNDEEIGLSDYSDDSLVLAVLKQPTETLITSAGTESRALRAAGSSTGGVANIFFASNTTGRSAGVPQAVVFLVRPLLTLSEFAYQKWPFLIKPKNPLLTSYAVRNGNF